MRVSHGTYRGLLAVIAVLGVFGLAGTNLYLHGTAEVPTWTATLTGAIVAFYFGERAVVVGSQSTNGNTEKDV